MKRALRTLFAVTILSGVVAGSAARAQTPAAAPAAEIPHKVALIDMAEVFKNYTKFEALREDLKAEIAKSEAQAKALADQIQQIQKEMKTFTEGSPDFLTREKELARLSSEFDTFRKIAQRDFLRKESQIYHTIYMEVTDTVRKFAEHNKYTLVIRFNREELDTNDPQTLIQGMNRQVVYHRAQDDMTSKVVSFMNNQYAAQTGGSTAPRSATAPAAGAPARQ